MFDLIIFESSWVSANFACATPQASLDFADVMGRDKCLFLQDVGAKYVFAFILDNFNTTATNSNNYYY